MRAPTLRIISMSSLVVLVAVFAGSPASADLTFSNVSAGAPGYEPGIDLLSDGTIFTNSPQGGSGLQSGLWRKRPTDAGFSQITFPAPYGRFPGGFDNDVATKGNRVYMLDLWVGSNSLLRSDDGGTTWTNGTPISTLGPSDREWIAVGKTVGGQDTVFALTAIIGGTSLTSPAMLAISRDSGLTWVDHRPVPLPVPKAGFSGQLLADDTGFVGFSYVEGTKAKFAGSPDEGQTWYTSEISGLSDAFGAHMQGVAQVGTTLHVVYTSNVGFGAKILYARSSDKGLTWSSGTGQTLNGSAYPPTPLSAPGSSMFPWVAAQGNKVAATWYQACSVAAPSTPTKFACTAPVTVPTDPNNVSAAGRWRIRYSESLDNGVTWSAPVDADPENVQPGFICTNGIGCTGGRQLGDFQQVVINAAGKSLIVYGRNGAGRVATQN